MTPILQDRLPELVWMAPASARLPGIQPVAGEDWLRRDEAFAPQMALRDRLIADRPGAVHALLPRARAAAGELYDMILTRLAADPGYAAVPGGLRRPDGVAVPLDAGAPLRTLGRLVQPDLCLLQPGPTGGEAVLTGAILCFPAGWRLDQKIGRPMTAIHGPVPDYDPDLAARVQRMLDAIRPGRPLWRGNALIYDDPDLHQPRAEGVPRPPPRRGDYVRSEYQVLMRLPRTGAVAFLIHTRVVRMAALPAEAAEALCAREGFVPAP